VVQLTDPLLVGELFLAARSFFRAASFDLGANGLACIAARSLYFTARSFFRAASFDLGANGLGFFATFWTAHGAVSATIRIQAAIATRHATRIVATRLQYTAGSVGAAIARRTTGSLTGMVHSLGGKANRAKGNCANNQRPKTFKHD
jgi:hypothetical protein